MNPRSTGLLLLVALGLGAFLYFYELGGEDARRESAERAKRLFPDLDEQPVEWIALRTRDGVDARFELHEGEWQLVEPIRFPADSALEQLAGALARMTSESIFEQPQPDVEYGLDDENARIVRFGGEGGERELRFGADTPIGSEVYARTGDSPSVYTLARYRVTAFERNLVELREKKILDFDRSAVQEIEASWPGGRVRLAREAPERSEGEGEEEVPVQIARWRLRAPLDARADDEAIDRLLSTLAYLRADDFVDEPGAEQRDALDPPDFEVVLRSEAGSRRLALSRPSADGLRRWVRAEAATLFAIGADRITDFPRETVAYRYRRLSDFPPADARQLDFYFQSEDGDPVAIHAERGAEGWTSEPERFAPGKLAGIVSQLSRLSARDILAESMGASELAELGLSPPFAILSVLGDPAPSGEGEGVDAPRASRLVELHLGRVGVEGIAARAVGNPVIYRLAPEAAEHLPVSLEAFRNRFRADEVREEEQPPGADEDLDLPLPAEESP